MKKILLIILLIIPMTFALCGCGSFFEEEVLEISQITTSQDSEGNTILKIEYTDETRQPDEFIIPKGVEGNGIQSITTQKNEKGDITTVTVNYTDKNMTPASFEVKDGVSVTGVFARIDEETGDSYLYVSFSDGSESEGFLMPKGDKGEDGKDGNGFTGFTKEDNEDGSQTYKFHFSQSEDVVVTIPAPLKGEDGKGISSIIGIEEDGLYKIEVNYTDNTSEVISFNKPKDPNTWISGSEKPSVLTGKNGDYFFDTYHKVIYAKENGEWIEIISFEQSTNYLTIQFKLNDDLDGGPQASMPSGSYVSYIVRANSYFTDNGYESIPIPTRDGYKFVGWYRSRTVSATSAPFTDMTPILSSLELYAQWEKIV